MPTKHELKSILVAIPLFKNLDPDEIDALLKPMSLLAFKAGEALLVEGTPSERLIVLIAGKVAVIKGDGESASHICDLDAGECVGEIGVLENAPCSANVKAVSDVEAASISREDLERFFSSNRLAAIKILRQVVTVLAGRLRRTNVSYSSLMRIADDMG
ncbi:MAG: cyclic nucleotide-binding domain-containing protein [Deltaproteobacteria bacterium]|nr:cyclic nucleotide-binding domain-containing protein [Deltaproteobacteria bacterium]